MGIVGCRQYNSYIYTECIGNNSRREGECGEGAQVLMNRIENVAVRRRQQEGWLERMLSTVANRCKICSLPTTLFQLQTIHNTVGRLSWSYETWFLTIKEGYRLRVFESGALRKTLGLDREEVTGDWRKLKSEELHALDSSPNTTQILEIAHHYQPTGKRFPGRPRKRWKWSRNSQKGSILARRRRRQNIISLVKPLTL